MIINTETWDNGRLTVNSEFAAIMRKNRLERAVDLWRAESEPVKTVVPDRGTERVWLKPVSGILPVETYIKRYQPFTFRDAFRALTSFKKPVSFDALHEWNAILAFHQHSLPTMTPIAAACTGRHTCNLTLGIKHYTRASDLVRRPDLSTKRRRRIILKIAGITGNMHRCGFAHQDLYLVHFFIKENENDSISVIDLQRLIMQKRLAARWRIKDLAQLLFSAGPFLSEQDIARFLVTYAQHAGVDLRKQQDLLKAVRKKAARIEQHHRRRYEA